VCALRPPAPGLCARTRALTQVRRADADRYCALRWQTSGWGAAEPDIAPILKGLDALLDSPHVEADAYALLDAVLSDGAAGRYYQPLAAPPPPGSAASGGAAGGAVAGGGGGGHSLGHAACWVQRQLVPAADAAVGEALAALRVEPTVRRCHRPVIATAPPSSVSAALHVRGSVRARHDINATHFRAAASRHALTAATTRPRAPLPTARRAYRAWAAPLPPHRSR
jgi:hypothetical protein